MSESNNGGASPESLEQTIARVAGDAGLAAPGLSPAEQVRALGVALLGSRTRSDDAWRFLAKTRRGGTIVSSAAKTSEQIAIARAAERMLVDRDGYGYIYVPGPHLGADEDAAVASPRCQCQWEAGDSPCPVHGDEST